MVENIDVPISLSENNVQSEECSVELKKIELISSRLNAFIEEAVKNYPSNTTRKLHAVSMLITGILEKNDTPSSDAVKLNKIYRLIEDFTPNNSNSAVIEEENSFNLDEVLNPQSNLDLLELCRELGVTE